MRASLGSLAASDGLDDEQSDELAAEAPFSSIQQNELKTMLAANNQELLDAMRAMLKSNDASESAEATIPAGGRPVGGDKTGSPHAVRDGSMSGQPDAEKPVLEHDDFVPDLGRESVHARALFEGGDTYSRPQRYVMRNDVTYARAQVQAPRYALQGVRGDSFYALPSDRRALKRASSFRGACGARRTFLWLWVGNLSTIISLYLRHSGMTLPPLLLYVKEGSIGIHGKGTTRDPPWHRLQP